MSLEGNGDEGFEYDLFGPGEEDGTLENGITEIETARVNSKVGV